MKYIDAERLQKEVKRLERAAHKSALDCADSETRKFHEGKALAYQFVGILIDSFQQEQREVDLGELINDFLLNNSEFLVEHDSKAVVQKLARHFFELGLNAKKEK